MSSTSDQPPGGSKKANITDLQTLDQELMKIRTTGSRREKNMGGADVFPSGSETHGAQSVGPSGSESGFVTPSLSLESLKQEDVNKVPSEVSQENSVKKRFQVSAVKDDPLISRSISDESHLVSDASRCLTDISDEVKQTMQYMVDKVSNDREPKVETCKKGRFQVTKVKTESQTVAPTESVGGSESVLGEGASAANPECVSSQLASNTVSKSLPKLSPYLSNFSEPSPLKSCSISGMGSFTPLPTFYFPHEHTVQYSARLPRRRRLNSTGSYDINDCKECGGNFKGGGSFFANRKAHGMHVHVPKIKYEFSSEESSTDDESRAVEMGIQTSPALMLKDFWKSRVQRFRKKVIK